MRPFLIAWLEQQGLPAWLAPTYWLMLTTAIAIACLLVLWLWKRQGRDLKIASDLLFWGIPGLFLGSKFFYFLQFGFPQNLEHWWHPQGFALYGGLAGILLVWSLYHLRHPYPRLAFLDTVTPGLALGLSMGRLGCLLAGCNGGRVCDLPWALSFPAGSPPYLQQLREGLLQGQEAISLPIHPTQLYESLFGLASFGLLIHLGRQTHREGEIFFTGMFWYASYRFASEFLRNDSGDWRLFGILTFSQSVSLLLATTALVWFQRQRLKRR